MTIMRMLVMFDLPTRTKRDKDHYVKFKRFLEDDGYQREQNSVYSRNLMSRAATESHRESLYRAKPPGGYVLAFLITEQEYVDREIIVDTRPSDDGTNPSSGIQLCLNF